MILIKNTANQVVYAKLIDSTTLLAVTGVVSGSLSGYISKDGGSETSVTNSISEVGRGIYKLTLTQAETNCITASVQFIHNSVSTYIFEPIFFQTRDAIQDANVITNADKTGYFLDNNQSFTTTGSIGSVTDATSILTLLSDSTYDGISQSKINKMLISFMANKVVITQVDPNTRLISYKLRDGTTESFNVTVSTVDGSRSSGGTII